MSIINHKDLSFEERLSQSLKVLNKYPNRICCYVERSEKSRKVVNDIEKHKYIVPNTLTVAEFIIIIRKKISITPEQGLFFFVNNITISGNTLLSDIYTKHSNDDGFLYITYSAENCFGGN